MSFGMLSLWMDTQIDGRETLIDREPVEMLPGACSNPEPPAAIVERPLGSLDLAWYMLAEAEISSGIDVGVDRTLPSKLQGGPILFMEVDKRNRRITRDLITSDANHFAMDLGPYLAGVEYFRLHGKSLRETSNAIVPARESGSGLVSRAIDGPPCGRRRGRRCACPLGLRHGLEGQSRADGPPRKLVSAVRLGLNSLARQWSTSGWAPTRSLLPP